MKKNLPFKDKKNVMVITAQSILTKENNILIVSHDEDDGIWQFLDNNNVNEDEARIVSLEEIYCIDKTIKELSNMPIGWIAWRENKEDNWKRIKKRINFFRYHFLL